MSNPTTGQIGQMVNLLDEKKTSKEVLDALFKQGILANVLGTTDPSIVDRDSLRKVLAGLRVEVKGFPIWKSLTIGGVSRDELLKKLVDGGHRVSNYARNIMEKKAFTTEKKRVTVGLVRETVKGLGFTENPTTAELFSCAQEHGLKLCPAEVGPHLRLVYGDQPVDEWNWIAMRPITGSDGNPRVFRVERSSDSLPFLDTNWANPMRRWDLGNCFVFASSK